MAIIERAIQSPVVNERPVGGIIERPIQSQGKETNVINWLAEQAGPIFGNKPEDVRSTIGQINKGAYGTAPNMLMGSAQDYLGVPASFIDAMGFTYPKKVLKKFTGMEVPKSKSTAGRVGENLAGAYGFYRNPVIGAAGGPLKLLNAPLRVKAGVGALNAVVMPGEELINPIKEPGKFIGEKAVQGTLGAGLGVGAPLAVRGAKGVLNIIKSSPKIPEWLAGSVSGITDFSKQTIKRLGSKIFDADAAHREANYIGTNFTPRFREHLFSQIENLGLNWKNTAQLARLKPEQIKVIQGMGRESRKEFVSAMRQGMTADDAAAYMVDRAGKSMESVIFKQNKPIVINNFVNGVKGVLLKERLAVIDNKGQLVPHKLSPINHETRDNLINIYNYYKNPPASSGIVGGGMANTGTTAVVSAKDWQVLKTSLERIYTGNPNDDRIINQVMKTLIEDAKSSGRGIAGYKEAAKLWHDAKSLQDIAPKFDQWTDPKKIEAMFSGLNATNARSHYNLLNEIKGSIPGNLYDELTAHYTLRNFDPNFNTSLAGLRKLGITKGSEWYYRNYPSGINPVQSGLTEIGKFGQRISQPVAPYVEGAKKMLNEPMVSPETKAAAARVIKGRRGSILIPGGGPSGNPPFKKSSINNAANPNDVHVLIHYSNQNTPELMIDPKYMGTAHAGGEMVRKGPKTTAHYLAEHVDQYSKYHEKNWRFKQSQGKYVSVIPKSQVYDWNADPLEYNKRLTATAAEIDMKRKGYQGFLSGHPPQVRLFHPIKGTKID